MVLLHRGNNPIELTETYEKSQNPDEQEEESDDKYMHN